MVRLKEKNFLKEKKKDFGAFCRRQLPAAAKNNTNKAVRELCSLCCKVMFKDQIKKFIISIRAMAV